MSQQRVVNARGLVWVDGYAVPQTKLGQAVLKAAIADDVRNGFVPGMPTFATALADKKRAVTAKWRGAIAVGTATGRYDIIVPDLLFDVGTGATEYEAWCDAARVL